MSLIGLLVALIVLCFFVWAAQKIIAAFQIQDPIKSLIWVGLVGLALLIVLGYLKTPLPFVR